MCSVFFSLKSWKTTTIMINVLYILNPALESVELHYIDELHSTSKVFSGEEPALIIHLVHIDLSVFSHTGLSNKVTTDQHFQTVEWWKVHSLNIKHSWGNCNLHCRIWTTAVREQYSTLMWYSTLPAKCRMAKVGSAFEDGTKSGLSWCCCFSLSNRVSSVASGRLKKYRERDKISISTSSKWDWLKEEHVNSNRNFYTVELTYWQTREVENNSKLTGY